MTQREKITNYIDQWGSITPMDAFMDLGITKLATQISLMIRDGVKIKKTMTKAKNRWGEPVHFMTYSWLKEDAATSSEESISNKQVDVNETGENNG